MNLRYLISAMALGFMLSGCGPAVSLWRHEATLVIDRVRIEGGERHFPDEFRSAEEAMLAGEEQFRREDVPEADRFFLLALTKGKLLEARLLEAVKRQEEEQRQAEIRRLEAVRQQELQEELKRRLERERAAQEEAPPPEIKKKQERPRPVKERQPLPLYHTAKRGETLPLIAAQPEVYGDPALWPLLYRANRDQIKDPRHIWPGQVLRIPRNVSREDISEARRYSQERPIY